MPRTEHSGWFGTRSQLLHVLRTFGCDPGDNGGFRTEGVTYLLDDTDPDADVVVGPEARCFVASQPRSLIGLLYVTSYGFHVGAVITGEE